MADKNINEQLQEIANAVQQMSQQVSQSGIVQQTAQPVPVSQGISISPGKFIGLIITNLAVLAAIGGGIWIGLQSIAKDIAKETATKAAQESTKSFLNDDVEIRKLANRAAQDLLLEVEARLSTFRNQEREIFKTLREVGIAEALFKRDAEEIRSKFKQQSDEFNRSAGAINDEVRRGKAEIAKLQKQIESGKLFENAERLKAEITKLSKDIDGNVKLSLTELNFARGVVSQAIADLQKTARSSVDEMKSEILNNKDLLGKVAAGAAKEFSKPGELDKLLVGKLEPRVLDKDNKFTADQRSLALQFYSIFAGDKRLATSLLQILENADPKNERLISIALQSFPAAATLHPLALALVLKRLSGSPPRRRSLRNSYARFLSRLPFSAANNIGIEIPNIKSTTGRAIALNGLVAIGGNDAANHLLNLAKSGNKSINELGWSGLADIDVKKLDDQKRRDTLIEVWRLMVRSIRSARVPSNQIQDMNLHLVKLSTALRERDISRFSKKMLGPRTNRKNLPFYQTIRKKNCQIFVDFKNT